VIEDRLTTKLDTRNEKTEATMMLEETLTLEERLCSSVADEIQG